MFMDFVAAAEYNKLTFTVRSFSTIDERTIEHYWFQYGYPHQRVVKAGEAIHRKRPRLLRRGVVLQHNNATPHSVNLTQQWLQRYSWEILPHPAHSPDLAPSDFHLFGPLKRHLGGMAFETEDDLISELRNWFDNLDVDFFRVGINSLLSRWQKCIDLHGDYVEK
ncbi:histone-lysine N-methyltransferase SETMAR [Plakobranchus ocellatus]|uniref:Histone-lysine N-methyltransferase SETMAR n=1 Tax=Plakobranchus ocellatus TaxID=259542 RepID=A0AAV4CM47_9GAST|nr:histone-lysine N-methyltransferase SETMAR [Plakobranchus ocellatus]